MPNCFSLMPIGGKESVSLQDVDNKMREAFGAEPDPVNWYENWYDIIGFSLATGKTPEYIRELLQDEPELLAILTWIEANYVVSAWYERR